VNDSATPLGSNRDRHANLPEGELGREGLAAFLSEPRFEKLPALLEGAGDHSTETMRRQVQIAKELRQEGLAARGGAKSQKQKQKQKQSQKQRRKP
jgi:deoxyribonuclease-4